jgi:hypothetical protein
MADAAMTMTSAVSVPVAGPWSVIVTQLTLVALLPLRLTLATIVSGFSSTRPVRSAWRSGTSADGRATTGQPKLLQNPQLLQACWPL